MWQRERAEMPGTAEPNASRSTKALIGAGIQVEKVTTGYKDISILRLNPSLKSERFKKARRNMVAGEITACGVPQI
jgi:hypothetical protein